MTKSKRIITIILIIALLGFISVYYGMYFNGLSGKHSNINFSDGQIKVACIGDSTTYGHGIKNWKNNNYPALLQKELGDDYCVANFGINGACVQSFSDKPFTETEIFEETLDFDADIIIFMLGTNDSKDENFRSTGDFKKEYLSLINCYSDNEKNPEIFLCTPPSVIYENNADGINKFGINTDNLEKISVAICEITSERNINLIDIKSFTQNKPEWFSDGLHPNNEGALQIAKTISEFIK